MEIRIAIFGYRFFQTKSVINFVVVKKLFKFVREYNTLVIPLVVFCLVAESSYSVAVRAELPLLIVVGIALWEFIVIDIELKHICQLIVSYIVHFSEKRLRFFHARILWMQEIYKSRCGIDFARIPSLNIENNTVLIALVHPLKLLCELIRPQKSAVRCRIGFFVDEQIELLDKHIFKLLINLFFDFESSPFKADIQVFHCNNRIVFYDKLANFMHDLT